MHERVVRAAAKSSRDEQGASGEFVMMVFLFPTTCTRVQIRSEHTLEHLSQRVADA